MDENSVIDLCRYAILSALIIAAPILVIGMMMGTLFTLVLLPAIYALLASDHPRETAGSEGDTASEGATDGSESGRMSDLTVST